MQKIFISLLFLFFSLVNLQAQSIGGKVIDEETGEPIAFATVFFSGTLIGTTTDLEGNFQLKYTQNGKYDLIVSYVGYQEYITSIELSGQPLVLDISLKPEVIELSEVFVNPDTTGWKDNFQLFREQFIGKTSNAQDTEILNPKDIFLFYDKKENALYAHAKKEIIIENSALGYRIYYILKSFEVNFKQGTFLLLGIPRFEELTPKNKVQQKRWSRAREKTYFGSPEHFFSSLAENVFDAEGYIVQQVFSIQNLNRPPQDLIDKMIKKYSLPTQTMSFNSLPDSLKERVRKALPEGVEISEGINFSQGKVSFSQNDLPKEGEAKRMDSLRYWSRMNREPLYKDSLGSPIKDYSELFKDGKLFYSGLLELTYKREREDPRYAWMRPGGGTKADQTSRIYSNGDVNIYSNGYFDVLGVTFYGYLAWSSKVAEILPLDYSPDSSD